MKTIYKTLKEKKFAGKQIRICLACGSDKISTGGFTILCKECGKLNFYEEI